MKVRGQALEEEWLRPDRKHMPELVLCQQMSEDSCMDKSIDGKACLLV